MALTPEGTPYVESSDLVANYPAASLSLANRVDLVGVLPFATSAARATAIPSPTDGQFSYLQDTNATQFWDGSAWQNVAISPGLVHINTTTFTTQSSVNINNVFTSTYNNYLILMKHTATTASVLSARLRLSGTDNTANSYTNQRLAANDTVTNQSRVTTTSWNINEVDSTTINNLNLTLFSPAIAEATTGTCSGQRSTNTSILEFRSLAHTVNTAYDGLTVFLGSGTMTGNLRIYGYNNG